MIKSTAQALAEIRKLSANYIYSDPTEINDAQPIYCQQWSDVVDSEVQINTLLNYNGTKYLVKQTHTASEAYLPDSEGSIALYQAYRGAELQAWQYGEYSEIGYQRSYNGINYTALQDTGANIDSPDLAISVWDEEKGK